MQKNILKFSYDINYKYERHLSHFIDRFDVVTKFHPAKINDIPMILRKMPVDYNNCD